MIAFLRHVHMIAIITIIGAHSNSLQKNVAMFVPAVNNIVTLHVEFDTNFSVNMYAMISYI